MDMKKLFSSLLVIATALGAHAQQAGTELRNLINQSFTYYPRFQELEQTVRINEQRVDLAETATRPVISGNGSYNYVAPVPEIPFTDANGNTKNVQFQPHHNFNTGISIMEPIYDFGRTKLSIERARQDVQ